MSIREIITPDLLKQTTIAGVDLTLDDGTPFPDVLFEAAIDQAVSIIETDLQINIDPLIVEKERHDTRYQDRDSFFMFKLDQRPVVSVDNVRIQHGNYTPIDIPDAWYNLILPRHGQFQLIPTTESLGGFIITNNGLVYPGLLMANYEYFPGYFSLDYTCGFQFDEGDFQVPAGPKGQTLTINFNETMLEKSVVYFDTDKVIVKKMGPSSFVIKTTEEFLAPLDVEWKSTTVPSNLVRAVLIVAAMLPLDVAGDLIIGAGISEQSISVDGLSQQVSTTSSATNAGYGARIHSYRAQLKMIMAGLHSQYRSTGIVNI